MASNRLRRAIWMAALVLLSLLLFATVHLLDQFGSRLGLTATPPVQVATIHQNRSNYTASTVPLPSFPTVTSIVIKFPIRMTQDETGLLSVEVRKFTEVIDLFSTRPANAQRSRTFLEPVKMAGRAMEIKLISSGFEVAGFSTSRENTRYPLLFQWTISPRHEGRQVLLLDVSDIADTALADGPSSGRTEVRIGTTPAMLQDGTRLRLVVNVTGPFGLPTWVINLVVSIPALLGFLLNYPLVVDWVKRRFGTRATDGPPATSDSSIS